VQDAVLWFFPEPPETPFRRISCYMKQDYVLIFLVGSYLGVFAMALHWWDLVEIMQGWAKQQALILTLSLLNVKGSPFYVLFHFSTDLCTSSLDGYFDFLFSKFGNEISMADIITKLGYGLCWVCAGFWSMCKCYSASLGRPCRSSLWPFLLVKGCTSC
jgi:hypothetical protein